MKVFLTASSWVCLLGLTSFLLTGCPSRPPTFSLTDPWGQAHRADRGGVERREYEWLADRFVENFQKSPLYEKLKGDPDDPKTPGLAALPFKLRGNHSLGFDASRLEQRLSMALGNIGVRFIDEDAQQVLLKKLEMTRSDLYDQRNRVRLGRMANAAYYLSGSIFSNENKGYGRVAQVRETSVSVKILETESGLSKFNDEFATTKRTGP